MKFWYQIQRSSWRLEITRKKDHLKSKVALEIHLVNDITKTCQNTPLCSIVKRWNRRGRRRPCRDHVIVVIETTVHWCEVFNCSIHQCARASPNQGWYTRRPARQRSLSEVIEVMEAADWRRARVTSRCPTCSVRKTATQHRHHTVEAVFWEHKFTFLFKFIRCDDTTPSLKFFYCRLLEVRTFQSNIMIQLTRISVQMFVNTSVCNILTSFVWDERCCSQ